MPWMQQIETAVRERDFQPFFAPAARELQDVVERKYFLRIIRRRVRAAMISRVVTVAVPRFWMEARRPLNSEWKDGQRQAGFKVKLRCRFCVYHILAQ
jgi:hypothetical protein